MPNMKSISYGSKVMAKVKVFCHRQSHRQTGQKIDAPEFHYGGIKMFLINSSISISYHV